MGHKKRDGDWMGQSWGEVEGYSREEKRREEKRREIEKQPYVEKTVRDGVVVGEGQRGTESRSSISKIKRLSSNVCQQLQILHRQQDDNLNPRRQLNNDGTFGIVDDNVLQEGIELTVSTWMTTPNALPSFSSTVSKDRIDDNNNNNGTVPVQN
uniref:Uncharacterized protein n=1 Tax=Vespula pensylvanica TaxID=30213 RepID=A0A834JIE5_VESPE|nr:hypothetical protein H0235_018366 [Vespula pensylvanica]